MIIGLGVVNAMLLQIINGHLQEWFDFLRHNKQQLQTLILRHDWQTKFYERISFSISCFI